MKHAPLGPQEHCSQQPGHSNLSVRRQTKKDVPQTLRGALLSRTQDGMMPLAAMGVDPGILRRSELTQRCQLQAIEQKVYQVGYSQEHQFKQMNNKFNNSVQNLSNLIEKSNSSTSNSIQALENKFEQLNTEYENKIKSLEMVLLDQQSTQAKILDEKFNKIYNQIR